MTPPLTGTQLAGPPEPPLDANKAATGAEGWAPIKNIFFYVNALKKE